MALARQAVTLRATAGDGILNPVAVVAVLVLLLNDHVWKTQYPGFVTGKVSGVAGFIFFPLLLQAFVEVAALLRRRPCRPSRHVLLACTLCTGAVAVGAEVFPIIDNFLEIGWGLLRWPVDLAQGEPFQPAALTQDATDLFALPALLIAWALGRSRAVEA